MTCRYHRSPCRGTGRRVGVPAAVILARCPSRSSGPDPPRVRPATTPVAAVVTHRAAVLGMPIEHSLSPVLHTAAYAELGLSGWDYGRYAVDEAGLPGFVAGLGPEWVGLSLTMPLKRVALEVADEVTPDTAAIGAANTLVRRGGAEPGREPTIPCGPGWLATNTDVVGIEQALRAVGVTAVESAVVVGAGGTAQAALAALRGARRDRTDGARARPGPGRCAARHRGAPRRDAPDRRRVPEHAAPARGRRDLHGARRRRGRARGRRLGPRGGAPRRHLRAVAHRPGRGGRGRGLPGGGRARGAAAPGRRARWS